MVLSVEGGTCFSLSHNILGVIFFCVRPDDKFVFRLKVI
jgi:hypothetical protein